MPQAEFFLLFTQRLDQAGVAYMTSGSVASILYGEPRLTNDIDLIVDLQPNAVAALPAVFPSAAFYCPPEEVLKIEVARRQRGHFNLIHHASGHKADVYLLGEDPLHAWAFSRRRLVDLGGGDALWVAPPEYVILRKLQYFQEGGSEKHVRDIRGVLHVSAQSVDLEIVREWARRLGLTETWQEIAAEE